jgi:hypothetical protein
MDETDQMDETEPKTLKVLSIDAWRDGDGWTWNNHYKVGEITSETLRTLDTNRKLLAYMRREGYLSASSVGKITVNDGANYSDTFIEFQARGTREPIFAISAIH